MGVKPSILEVKPSILEGFFIDKFSLKWYTSR